MRACSCSWSRCIAASCCSAVVQHVWLDTDAVRRLRDALREGVVPGLKISTAADFNSSIWRWKLFQ